MPQPSSPIGQYSALSVYATAFFLANLLARSGGIKFGRDDLEERGREKGGGGPTGGGDAPGRPVIWGAGGTLGWMFDDIDLECEARCLRVLD